MFKCQGMFLVSKIKVLIGRGAHISFLSLQSPIGCMTCECAWVDVVLHCFRHFEGVAFNCKLEEVRK
jgi:hypothetical protein